MGIHSSIPICVTMQASMQVYMKNSTAENKSLPFYSWSASLIYALCNKGEILEEEKFFRKKSDSLFKNVT